MDPLSWRDPWVWALPAVCLVLALLLTLTQANQPLFLYLNQIPGGAVFWSSATLLGDSLVAMTLLLLLVGRRPDMIWAAFLAAILATLWVHGLKPALDIPRPTAVLPLDLIRVIGPEIHARAFPSGHTTTAFTLAGILALGQRQAWLRWGLIAVACVVGLSRVVVSAHWPMDVLAGALGGWLAAWAGWSWSLRWQWGRSPRGQRILATLLSISGFYLLLVYDARYPLAQPLQVFIALASLLGGGWPLMMDLFRQRPS